MRLASFCPIDSGLNVTVTVQLLFGAIIGVVLPHGDEPAFTLRE